MSFLEKLLGSEPEEVSHAAIELQDKYDAINRVQAIIEFDTEGHILDANENFLSVMGYSLDDILSKHHRMFVDPSYASSSEYSAFWADLRQGKSFSKDYQRVAKGGKTVWINASYNPLKDENGVVYKIIKFATDITESRLKALDNRAKLKAIDTSQASIEFNVDGTIITANQNFLNAMGYSLGEIQGQHHRMFVDAKERNSAEYKAFWENLAKGEYQSGEYRRFGKGDKEIWIQASYNPIIGFDGKPFKVVKYATDITAEKMKNADFDGQLQAISKSQAVIEFELDGTIRTANQNFLDTLGYALPEVQGQHHRLFVDKTESESAEYKQFWQGLASGSFTSGEFKRIAKNGEEIWIQASYNPIMDMNGRPFKVVKYATDITAQKKLAEQNKVTANISNALKLCQANVMLTNRDLQVVYVNNRVERTFANREKEMRQVLSNFSASSMMGMRMESLFSDPAKLRKELNDLREPYKNTVEFGGLVFDVIASPWKGVDGKELGLVFEWIDRTADAIAEREIDDIITSVGRGDFSLQASLEGKKGIYLKLAKGLNSLTGTVEVALNDIIRVLGAMAKGDLSERITRDYQGAFGQLKSDANATADKLTEIIGKIRSSANTIATSSSEIAQGNADLSRRTEQQASSLQETAASMEEMTSTVRQSAENAGSANDKAITAQKVAQQGGEVVKNAVASMDEINAASKKISDIISVIDEIAFQTNLLALNAAVEAARAGEQGRGFAVVAGEVRNLAQRSAGAAKEIKDLIRDTVQKVEDGTELVNASGETLGEIVQSVEEVVGMMQEIASAAQEQTTGIEQVNTAISSMDETTQKNAALVEEAMAASESMSEQSHHMTSAVSFFSSTDDSNLEVPVTRQAIETEAESANSEREFTPRTTSKARARARTFERRAERTSTRAPAPKAPVMESDDEWEEF